VYATELNICLKSTVKLPTPKAVEG